MANNLIVHIYVFSTEEAGYEENVATKYADLFPGYPEHLIMPRDLANFVS